MSNATNVLEQPIYTCDTSSRTKKGNLLTLLAGIVCRDGIVIASDSQTTYDGTSKIRGVRKVSLVEFKNGSAIIGEAGSDQLSSNAVQRIKSAARGIEIKDDEAVAQLVRNAVREVRTDQENLFHNPADPFAFWNSDDRRFSLMCAHALAGTPQLFTVDVGTTLPTQPKMFFATCGTGSQIGSYLLTEYGDYGMSVEYASALALYAVDESTKVDNFCDSPFHLATISAFHLGKQHGFSVRDFPEQSVNELVELIRKLGEDFKLKRRELLEQKLRERTEAKLKEMFTSNLDRFKDFPDDLKTRYGHD